MHPILSQLVVVPFPFPSKSIHQVNRQHIWGIYLIHIYKLYNPFRLFSYDTFNMRNLYYDVEKETKLIPSLKRPQST